MSQQPRKVSLESKDWRSILQEVEKKEIPVEVMERLTVNLVDGNTVEINVRELMANGENPNAVHAALQRRLDEMEHYIDDIDFHINIDAVIHTIQPVTDKILKDL